MQKYIFLGFLSTVLTVACHPSPNDSKLPSSTDAGDKGGTLSLRSDVDTGSSSSGPAVSGSSSSDTVPSANRPLAKERFVSLEEAEQRVDFIEICDFKDDYILETVSVSGQDLIIKGSEEPAEINEIIKEKTWRQKTWRELLKFDLMADFERAGRQVIPEGDGGGIVAVYFYDRNEQYGHWCPSEEQEKCIVQVIYRGSIQRRDSSVTEEGQPLDGTGEVKSPPHIGAIQSPEVSVAEGGQPLDGIEEVENSPHIGAIQSPEVSVAEGGQPLDGTGEVESPPHIGAIQSPEVSVAEGGQPLDGTGEVESPPRIGSIQREGFVAEGDQPLDETEKVQTSTRKVAIQRRNRFKVTDREGFLSDWQYTGDLKVQIYFSNRILNFSRCSDTAD